MDGESLQLNGHTFTDFHASLDRSKNILRVITTDPYLLELVRETRPAVLKGEYHVGGIAYGLEDGVLKAFDLQNLKYMLIFETIVEAY